jgi:hypothetical protein
MTLSMPRIAMMLLFPGVASHSSMAMTDSELRNIFRMPAVLGPAAGPRNMPRSKEHLRFKGETLSLSVTALSDAAALAQILPPRCRLAAEPLLTVAVMKQTGLGWLAGRGYNIVALRIPVLCSTAAGETPFSFTPVLWENMSDPITTGREELGSPKLYANIPDPLPRDDGYDCSCDWDGFRFFHMKVRGLKPVATPPPVGDPLLLYRYFSRVGDWEKPDIAQLTRAHKGEAPAPVVHDYKVGSGSFAFKAARWEDMPTQYTFVNALAALPLREFRGARMTYVSNIPDIAAQEIIG